MGIHRLMNLIQDRASRAIRSYPLESYAGRTIVCDAATAMYKFMVIMQGYHHESMEKLVDKKGNNTAHLLGLWTRTIHYLDHGIKPVWVFEGEPPTFKSGEQARESQVKDQPTSMNEALESGQVGKTWSETVKKVKFTPEMNEDAKKMLKLMGLPFIQAPSEAEAQCAVMVKSGKAYATFAEDMDPLAFGSPRLLKGFKGKKNRPINEIILEDVLKDLGLSKEEFIDLCILCGTDFNDKLEGIGPITAYKLVKEFGKIENITKHIEEVSATAGKRKRLKIPERFPYKEVRKIFLQPEVIDPEKVDLTWEKPNEAELKAFMCEEKLFGENRIDLGVKRLLAFDREKIQSSLEPFFGKKEMRKRAKRFEPEEKQKAGGYEKKKRKSRTPSKREGTVKGKTRAKSARAR